MSDDTTPVLLRAIRTDVADLRADIAELKERVGALEGSVASLFRRVDRMGSDLEHITRRLDIVDETVGGA